MKGKRKQEEVWEKRNGRKKLGIPAVFLLCSLFFVSGFFGSSFLSHDMPSLQSPPRLLESIEEDEETTNHNLARDNDDDVDGSVKKQDEGSVMMAHGLTGNPVIDNIPFQAFNVLRYKIGQRYVSHYDAFNPDEYGPQKSQRMASFLLYLSDVEEGGETMFPFENGSNMDIGYDYEKCIGLKMKPRRGDGLLFYSLLPNGTIDQISLHGSCPVIKGEKWVATKWIRNQCSSYS